MDEPLLLDARGLEQDVLERPRQRSPRGPRGAGRRPRHRAPARPTGWSASRARASPPPGASCCGSSSPMPAGDLPRRGPLRALGRGAAPDAPPHAAHLPGPLLLGRPALPGPRHRGRAVGHPRALRAGRAPPPCRRAAGARGHRPGPGRPPAGLLLGRSAAAHRHRPGPGAGARARSSATSRSPPSMSRCRARSSICSWTCRPSAA